MATDTGMSLSGKFFFSTFVKIHFTWVGEMETIEDAFSISFLGIYEL